jgi:predicted nicotinamide N-methyase
MLCFHYVFFIVLLNTPFHNEFPDRLMGFSLNKVKLRQHESSPWTYTASVDPTIEQVSAVQKYNFLATQVWPSAREASFFLEKHVNKSWKCCELGCGPGLPSLTMAQAGCKTVIATDVDEVALEMVQKAANEQQLTNLQTMKVDLTGPTGVLDEILADLYIMSDVFENSQVAFGAANMTMNALNSGARCWVFAQSDRAQRNSYIEKLQELGAEKYGLLEWRLSNRVEPKGSDTLLLIDLDEVNVDYGC